MNPTSFLYHGKEYIIAKITESESDSGNRCLKITTKCKKQFLITYYPSIFKWVISEPI
jgi:hypothetical protein